ncbi:MAG: M23 family metallopeptidase [Gammaproteobacteria bacterium]|nr:M23 family metallopeptidase [Gammaproteobacteria bacterium]MYK42481.1 M23 family metallopeptidase [Gammaproteobacteria bacterium]
MERAMRRACWQVPLACGLISLTTMSVHTDGECPSDMEDCITVVEPRLKCDHCTKEKPERHAIDCYMELVALPNVEISGPYGEDRDGRKHKGLDLEVPTGTDVFAAKNGIISEVVNKYEDGDSTTPNGNFVRIVYEDKSEGVYIHLKKVIPAVVSKDQEVKAGDKIGKSNDTGWSDGPHLHYQEYTNTKRTDTVDPEQEYSDCPDS